jgi:radical SAM superfamily enzyme YgiQ (UPF0313 family)
MMAESGCKEVSVVAESGDQRVLDFLNKKTNLAKLEEGCSNAKKEGLNVRGLFIIGTPGEHPDTPEINSEFINRDIFHSVTLSTFVPLPGSPIWCRPQDFNCEIISRDFSKYNRDYWINIDGEKTRKESAMLIRNNALTEAQQLDNIKRMERYVLETGKLNQG